MDLRERMSLLHVMMNLGQGFGTSMCRDSFCVTIISALVCTSSTLDEDDGLDQEQYSFKAAVR